MNHWLASFPGPAQLSVASSTNGKLGGTWERGYPWLGPRVLASLIPRSHPAFHRFAFLYWKRRKAGWGLGTRLGPSQFSITYKLYEVKAIVGSGGCS